MRAKTLQPFRWSAVSFGALLLFMAAAPSLAEAQSSRTAGSTRSGGSSGSASRGSSGGSSASSGRHAVSRSGSQAGRGSGTTTRHRTRGSDRSRGGRHYGYPYRGWGFGAGYGYYSYYYPYYYYGWGYPYWRYWEPYWYRYPAHRDLGAVDLNVRPKKAEVYVDGALVGKAGKYDGFPGYLWLERGAHELVFHYEGFETEVRRVRVSPGVVIDVELWMESGESRPAEEVMTQRGPAIEPRVRERRADAVPRRAAPEPRAPSEDAARDVRAEPGRVALAVEPADASVYLDGRFLGTASEMARLHDGLLVEAGDHVLEVVRPGFESKSLEFTVEAGGSVELEVKLEAPAAEL